LITVILNAYKRVEYLERQLEAINNQTVKPAKILVWQNAGAVIPEYLKAQVTFAECNENLGVWARFAYALNADTEYVCVFDDDTIPGRRWFENCLKTIETHEGLLGTRGLRFLSPQRYHPFKSFGWDGPTEETVQVDIVGHAWFFKREWLAAFWRELPSLEASKIAGEDIHFSYAIQKYLRLGTYVPPHPVNDLEMWGSQPEYAKRLGTSEAAISGGRDSLLRFDTALNYYTKRGFTLCSSKKERAQSGIVIGSGVRTNRRLKKLVERYPFLFKIAKVVVTKLEKYKIHV
jgi:hypothetical protein